MSLRAALLLALRDGGHAALRGVQRTASGALDRTEGALVGGASLAPIGLAPAGAAFLLTGGGFGQPDTFDDVAGFGMGAMGGIGALAGLTQGRRGMLRAVIGEGPKALAKYIRHLKRLGYHEEAAQAEVAQALAAAEQRRNPNAARGVSSILRRIEENEHGWRWRRQADREWESVTQDILRGRK